MTTPERLREAARLLILAADYVEQANAIMDSTDEQDARVEAITRKLDERAIARKLDARGRDLADRENWRGNSADDKAAADKPAQDWVADAVRELGWDPNDLNTRDAADRTVGMCNGVASDLLHKLELVEALEKRRAHLPEPRAVRADVLAAIARRREELGA